MKRVLVTGGCGFLGSHVCELFKDHGWEVLAYDNLTKYEYSRIDYFDVDEVRDYNLRILEDMDVTVIVDDIRNFSVLKKYTRHCDLIVHCAAQPAMTIAIEDPLLDFDVNVKGYLKVLECARYWRIPVVNCSTIHIYGNGINGTLKEGREGFFPHWGPQGIYEDENILTGELTPLHASKRSAEIYTQTYIDTYKLKAANFRLTGIYGPRQFGGEDHGWVANFAIKTELGLPIKIFGTDKQVRDILYVKDAAQAFYNWYEAGCPPGTYNIGGGVACITSLGTCLKILEYLTGKNQTISIEPPRKGDLYYFCCDTKKARRDFRWAPKVLPQEGISELLKWIQYENNRNRRLFRCNV